MKQLLKRLEAKIRRRKIARTPLDIAMLRLTMEVPEDVDGRYFKVSTGVDLDRMTEQWIVTVTRAPGAIRAPEYLQ